MGLFKLKAIVALEQNDTGCIKSLEMDHSRDDNQFEKQLNVSNNPFGNLESGVSEEQLQSCNQMNENVRSRKHMTLPFLFYLYFMLEASSVR